MYICRAAEAEKAQIQAMVEQNITVQAIEKKTRDIKPNKRYEKTSQQQKANADSFMYKKCGKLHLPRQCPAFGATCHACGKHNHFATMCKSEQKEAQPKHKRNVTVDSLFVGAVEVNQMHSSVSKAWYMDIDIVL